MTRYLTKSIRNLMKQKTERIWVEENKDINILNYWIYRYFTNRYIRFLQYNFRNEFTGVSK